MNLLTQSHLTVTYFFLLVNQRFIDGRNRHTLKSDSNLVAVDEGSDVRLDCDLNESDVNLRSGLTEAAAFSSLDFDEDDLADTEWKKDGKPLHIGTNPRFVYHTKNSSLTIKRVTSADDGHYQCLNPALEFPDASKIIHLKIKDKLRFVDPQSDKKLELNSIAKLYCKTRSYLPPTIYWIKNGSSLPNHVRQEKGTLTFNGVLSSDAGRYICFANDSITSINSTVNVAVVKAPKLVQTPPKQIEVETNSALVLHCAADGDPAPIIHWDKNNKFNDFEKNDDRIVIFPNGSLSIGSVQPSDEGKYGCIAGNAAGFERFEVNLIVKGGSRTYAASEYDEEEKMTRTILITAGAVTLYMLFVLILMIWCRYRNAKRKAAALMYNQNGDKVGLEMKDRARKGKVVLDPQEPEHTTLLSANSSRSPGLTSRGNNSSTHQHGLPNCVNLIKGEDHDHASQASSSRSSRRTKSPYDSLQYPRSDLIKSDLLGNGQFGEVYLATASGGHNESSEELMMVKSLQSREESLHYEFKREIDMFNKLSSPFIAHLIGVCAETDPFLMILEYTNRCDLKQHLLATQKDSKRNGLTADPLSNLQIIQICHQIALGMDHLTSNRFIHKDLACRNCLLTSTFQIKITHLSLSKDTYASDYIKIGNNDLPVRWAPHEAIFEDEWSAKSDVWSFGVLIWEILNQAKLPYHDKSDEILVALLKANKLTLKSSPSSDNLKLLDNLIASCCTVNPKERPDFAQIVNTLNLLLGS